MTHIPIFVLVANGRHQIRFRSYQTGLIKLPRKLEHLTEPKLHCIYTIVNRKPTCFARGKERRLD